MSSRLVFLSLLLPTVTVCFASHPSSEESTAYDALSRYNLPIGLLPKGVTGYELDSSTGQFRAFFNGSCSFSLEGSYQLKYKSTISGFVSENKLTDLAGVSVKILFLWLNIVEVARSGNNLEFSVGIASASFPIDNFNECPQCGCGMVCSKERTISFNSSSFAFY